LHDQDVVLQVQYITKTHIHTNHCFTKYELCIQTVYSTLFQDHTKQNCLL